MHDISQRLHAALPVWPGEPPVMLEQLAAIGPGCPVNVGAMRAPLHAGTHADAPCHYDPAGADSAAADLEIYVGPCRVMDVRHAGRRVEPADIDWAALDGVPRLLLRTYDRFPHDRWDSGFKAISADAIDRMGMMGVRLLGTDAPSLDPEDSKSLDAHQAIRRADMRILEGLVLDAVAPGRYELIALPLAIAGGDASPVRAVLRPLI